MGSQELLLAAAAGAVSLAICSALWALLSRRAAEARLAVFGQRLARAEAAASSVAAAAEAFDTALIGIEGEAVRLIAGEDGLATCADILNLATGASAAETLAAAATQEPDNARRLEALIRKGEACAFEVRGPKGRVSVEGRAAGALIWLKLAPAAAASPEDLPAEGLPGAERLAAFVDARSEPAWIARADGAPIWANKAWLAAVGVKSLLEAAAKGVTLDRAIDAAAREVAQSGAARTSVRWASVAKDRRAFRIAASPLEGGAVGIWTTDVTGAEVSADALKRLAIAHESVLNQVADALAIFSAERRLTFHNPSFATLWGLEPAWLAEGPSHAEILDRLRQRRRLPETGDFSRFKAEELARYEQLEPSAEAIWRLPGERTLRVVSQPHPQGGIVMLFSDITPELRLKTQFNQLIQVQQATLDKLTDAVAVFGADGRLKLHNEAFETFWSITAGQVAASGDFDALVELCVRRFHDLQFWRELKARITDPDPSARAAVSQEIVTADQRIVAYQSRPLPDGATLISFADVTDTRRLEGALSDREAALAEAERLKREFVGSVSYELRTPLTTIIGYSELLERASEGLTERGQGHVAAVKAAATQLARSINNVLDMAEIDAGEMALDVEVVDVAELLAEAARRWAREAEAEGVILEVAMADESGLIRGDARRLAQVVDHLAQNAIRNTPAGGRVTFAAERALGEIRLQVTDTGRGIPFHVQAHIFDRFGGPSRGGPGLGLALVKAIVELHGGWVALESEPNAGASFTCHLPEAAQVSAARPELF